MLPARDSPLVKAGLEALELEPPLPGVPGVIELALDELPSVRRAEMRKFETSMMAEEAGMTSLMASTLI